METRINQARKRKNLTIMELAAQTGVTYYLAAAWCGGRMRPARPWQIQRLHQVLDIPIEDILLPKGDLKYALELGKGEEIH